MIHLHYIVEGIWNTCKIFRVLFQEYISWNMLKVGTCLDVIFSTTTRTKDDFLQESHQPHIYRKEKQATGKSTKRSWQSSQSTPKIYSSLTMVHCNLVHCTCKLVLLSNLLISHNSDPNLEPNIQELSNFSISSSHEVNSSCSICTAKIQ